MVKKVKITQKMIDAAVKRAKSLALKAKIEEDLSKHDFYLSLADYLSELTPAEMRKKKMGIPVGLLRPVKKFVRKEID